MEFTIEVIGMMFILALWIGRMTKQGNCVIEYRDREKIVEKKVEVPTVVHACQHDCLVKTAQKLFDETCGSEWGYGDSDELIELYKQRIESMERCFKLATEIHSRT